MRLRLLRRTRPTGSGVFVKTLLLRYAVSDIVVPATVLEFRQRDWGFHLIAHHPSRTTSSGRLSSRRPRNRGCRSLPPAVHSVNPIGATSFGFTQCAPRFGSPSSAKRETGVSRRANFSRNRHSHSWLNPVPT